MVDSESQRLTLKEKKTVAPKLETFMEAQWLRLFSLFKYHLIAHSV